MSDWIDYPPPLVHSTASPVLVEASRVEELAAHVVTGGASRVDVQIAQANSSFDVIEALKAVLVFPDWCGSGWDSIEDAFEELRSAWSFPLLMVVRGYDRLLDTHQHVALETAIRLHALEQAFSVGGDQLIVAFEGTSWS